METQTAVKMTGKIIYFFWDTRGYGWIRPDHGNDHIFFHISACGKYKPTDGARVECEVITAEKGPRAIAVRPIN